MIKLFKNKTTQELLVICLLGLTPLLWFRNNEVILGHDAGLTLSPVTHFTDRLHVWTSRFGFGTDQSYAVPGFFIHGLEAIFYLGYPNVQFVQKITFIFWFVLPGLTMYYLAKQIEKKVDRSNIALVAAILYMFNHFLLQGWFVAERTKFSLYAALPLLIAWLFKWQDDKKISSYLTGLKLALLFSILNGEASLPLFGGVIVVSLVYFLVYCYRFWSLSAFKRLLQLGITTLFASFCLHAYWLLPYAQFVLHSYSDSVEFYGGKDGLLGWIKYISQESSLINLFRLQGIPEWYQNPTHPYANNFLNNPLLIAIAALIPMIAFSALVFVKDKPSKKIVNFFAILALFSMLFIGGSHPPFGYFYLLFSEYIPGFIAFRTPFYKFSPALLFSYSILFGFTFEHFYQKIHHHHRQLANITYFISCLAIILYSYPFLTGIFFDYIKNERSMRVQVPQYIYDYANWAQQSENQSRRSLMLPSPNKDSTIESYTWGYWSLAPLTSLLVNNQNINFNLFMATQEKDLVRKLYDLIETNDPKWLQLANFLQINTLVLRNDFDWQLKKSSTVNPEIYKKILSNTPSIKLTQKFDAWEVYTIKDYTAQHITQVQSLAIYSGDKLQESINIPIFDSSQPIYKFGSTKDLDSKLVNYADTFYIKPECVMCDNQWKFVNIDEYIPLFTRGSFLYPLFPNKTQLNPKDTNKVKYYAQLSLEKILAFRKAKDQKEDDNTLLAIAKDHNTALNNLKLEMSSNIDGHILNNSQTYEINTLLRTQRINLLDQMKNLSNSFELTQSDNLTSALFNSYQTLDSILNKTESNVWRSTTSSQKRLLADVPSTGTYQMLYRPNEKLFDSTTQITLKINDTSYTITPEPTDSDWFNMGKFPLEIGDVKFEFNQPLHNLFQNTASTIDLQSSYSGGCFVSNQIKGNYADVFRVTFQHSRKGGQKEFYAGVIPANINIHSFLGSDALHSQMYPSYYTKDYAIGSEGAISLVICDRPDNVLVPFDTKIQISDIVIQKLNIPDILLYKKDLSRTQPFDISYITNNNTKYQASLTSSEKPSIVVFDQSFNPNWQIDGVRGEHFKVNDYANAWILDSATREPQPVTISYKLELLLQYGFVLSAISLTCVILVLFIHKKKYAQKN